jgi:adenylate kinase
MLGAPATGKGTVASVLSEELNIPQISTGDLFRKNIAKKNELGLLAEKYISQGNLVPDEITIKMVKERLQNKDTDNGVILDGFPRTIPQAEALDEILAEKKMKIDMVLNLSTPEDEIIERVVTRRVCSNPECKTIYNVIMNPTKVEGICDVCGSSLYRRKDDYPEIIQGRLDLYHKETEPLIGYYTKEGLLEVIDIDIYSPTTKEDTTNKAIEIIKNRMDVKIEE